VTLNGSDGEALPTAFNPARGKQPDGAGPTDKAPAGMYTMTHAAGFGLLYQLTGDRKYAELGRQCFDRALDGTRDRDNRYSFRVPTGALRAGVTLGWYALGYDLCYDGWDEGYRRKIALALQDYNEGPWCSLGELALGKRQHPGSNHWGMEVGGGALALLAIMNDPGVDMGKIEPLLKASQEKNPGDVLPHACRDTRYGFYAWRNRWQDEEDIVISILTKHAKGNYDVRPESTLTIRAGGTTAKWGRINGGFTGDFKPARDGSTVLATGDGSCLAIDFSRASGAEGLLVMAGPGAPPADGVEVDGRKLSFLFLGKGAAPSPKVEGGKVVVGGQTVSYDGRSLVLGK
jgi:hypothetical protein